MAVWDLPEQQNQHLLYLLSSTFVGIPSILLFVFDISHPGLPAAGGAAVIWVQLLRNALFAVGNWWHFIIHSRRNVSLKCEMNCVKMWWKDSHWKMDTPEWMTQKMLKQGQNSRKHRWRLLYVMINDAISITDVQSQHFKRSACVITVFITWWVLDNWLLKILRHKSESVIINYYQYLLNLFKIEFSESVGSQPACCLSACFLPCQNYSVINETSSYQSYVCYMVVSLSDLWTNHRGSILLGCGRWQ